MENQIGTIVRVFPTGSVEAGDSWVSADIHIDGNRYVTGQLTSSTWRVDIGDKVIITSWIDDDRVTFKTEETTVRDSINDDNKMIVNALSNQGFKTIDDSRKDAIVNLQAQPTKWNADLNSEVTICCFCAKLCYLDNKETWCEHALGTGVDLHGEYGEQESYHITFCLDKSKLPVYKVSLNSSQYCKCPKCDTVSMCAVSDDGDHIWFGCYSCKYENMDGSDMIDEPEEEIETPYEMLTKYSIGDPIVDSNN